MGNAFVAIVFLLDKDCAVCATSIGSYMFIMLSRSWRESPPAHLRMLWRAIMRKSYVGYGGTNNIFCIVVGAGKTIRANELLQRDSGSVEMIVVVAPVVNDDYQEMSKDYRSAHNDRRITTKRTGRASNGPVVGRHI